MNLGMGQGRNIQTVGIKEEWYLTPFTETQKSDSIHGIELSPSRISDPRYQSNHPN